MRAATPIAISSPSVGRTVSCGLRNRSGMQLKMVVEMLAGGAKKDTRGSLFRKGEGLCIRLSDGGRSLVGVVAGAAAVTEAGAELIIDHTLIVTGFRADEDTDLFRRHGIDISPVCNQTLAHIRLRKDVVDGGIQPI